MATKRNTRLNTSASVSETDTSNVYLVGQTSETPSQAAARKSADNAGVATTDHIVDPDGLSVRVTVDTVAKTIEVQGIVPAFTTLRIEAEDGTAMLLGNSDNQSLASGTDYGFGPLTGQGDFLAQWRFGPRTGVSNSGILTNQRLVLTLKNAAGSKMRVIKFTPKTITGLMLLGTGAKTTTGNSGSGNAPSWIHGFRRTFQSGVLTLEGTAEIGSLKIERADGTSFTTGNPDGVTIVSGTYYGYGPLTGQGIFDRRWQINLATPAPSYNVTVKRATTNEYFTYTFTPVDGEMRVVMTVGTAPGGGGGGGGGGNVTPPSGNYLAGQFTFAPLATTDIPANKRVVQETTDLRVTLDMRTGVGANNGLAGGITELFDKNISRNQLANPVYRAGYKQNEDNKPDYTTDLGSGACDAFYRGVTNWNYNGYVLEIGDDPLENGDIHGQSSKLLAYGRGTVNGNTTDYTKIDMAQWDGPKNPSSGWETASTWTSLTFGDNLEKWMQVVGKRVHLWYLLTMNRLTGTEGPSDAQFGDRSQEMPAFHANGSMYKMTFYDGDAPYTNAPTRQIVLDDNFGQPQGTQFVTECWVAAQDDGGNEVGIIFETPIIKIGQYDGKFNNAAADGFGRAYMSWQPSLIIDKNITLPFSVVYVVGKAGDTRQAAMDLAASRRRYRPDYVFDQPGRQLWHMSNGDDGGHHATRTLWQIRFTGNEGRIVSPAVTWDAAAYKHVYVYYRYAQSSRASANMDLKWRRARQSDIPKPNRPGDPKNDAMRALYDQMYPEGSNADYDHNITVPLNTDGQWHVADFDMSAKATWRGIINEVQFQTDGAPSINEIIEIKWVWYNASGPVTI